VGITKFCIHPSHWRKEKQIIGGTKNFRPDLIDKLNPDLIIGNKEENAKEQIQQLQKKYSVWMSDIVSLNDAKNMICSMGQLTNRITEAQGIIENINASFEQLKIRSPRSVLYLIWRNPWMAAGSGTFIHSMLGQMGLVNCLENKPRYPKLSDDEIKSLNPDLIFLSSEPYPFAEAHLSELININPSSKIMLVDGEMFSWYGSRLVKAPQYFNSLVL
jgi:ABC-type Fe3+-hydroxamate transport system substrate-binding protein